MSNLLEDYFEQAAKALDALSVNSFQSLDVLRSKLLEAQRECLPESLDESTVRQNASHTASHRTNEAARRAYARLIWQSLRYRVLKDKMKLDAGKTMTLDDFQSVCGLVVAALKVPDLKAYVVEGKTAEGLDAAKTIPKRLEHLQRLYLEALDYDPAHGLKEIQRLLQESPTETEHAWTLLRQAVQTATAPELSDVDQGGFTRVVAVQHGETSQPVGTESLQRQQLRVASQAAALEQELWGELLSYSEDERQQVLERAKQASLDLQKTMSALPASERRAHLLSIDAKTQRLLAMYNLWNTMLQQNGGKVPEINYQPHG